MHFSSYYFPSHLVTYGPNTNYATPSLEEAQAYCLAVTRTHYENFSVAHRILARELVPHFCSVYGFCRWADDLADEVKDALKSRELLGWWRAELKRCFDGEATHPVFVALRHSIETRQLTIEPFEDLLDAFLQDQTNTRYATTAESLEYCRRSANPVGRIVLRLADCDDEENVQFSDEICTGLQLVNFCQDVVADAMLGRVYIPQSEFTKFACRDTDILASILANNIPPELSRVVESEANRAKGHLEAGRPLLRRVPRLIAKELFLFLHGGLAALDVLERNRYDVTKSGRVSRRAKAVLLFRAWWHVKVGSTA
jgi:squalene synthase HpnC